MLGAVSYCHAAETPDAYKEWVVVPPYGVPALRAAMKVLFPSQYRQGRTCTCSGLAHKSLQLSVADLELFGVPKEGF